MRRLLARRPTALSHVFLPGCAGGLLVLAVACGGSSRVGDGAGGSAGVAGVSTSGGSRNSGGSAAVGGGPSGGAAGAGATAGAAGSAGSAGSATGGAATGGSATGGAGGATEECVERTGSGGFGQAECSDLERLVVRNPQLDPADGVASGSKGTFRVDLTDVSGYGFNFYPGVDFETDTPGVTVSDEQFFAVLPCGTNQTYSNVEVDSSVPAGTEVTITATVMMLNEQCSDTDSVSYKFTVGPAL